MKKLLLTVLAFVAIFSTPAYAEIIWQEDFEQGQEEGEHLRFPPVHPQGIVLEAKYGSTVKKDPEKGNYFIHLGQQQCLRADLKNLRTGFSGDAALEFAFHPCYWPWGSDYKGAYSAGGFQIKIDDSGEISVLDVEFVFPERRPGKGYIRYSDGSPSIPYRERHVSAAGIWNPTRDQWYRVRLLFHLEGTGTYTMELRSATEGDWKTVFSDQPIFNSHVKDRPLNAGRHCFIKELVFFGVSAHGRDDVYYDDFHLYRGIAK